MKTAGVPFFLHHRRRPVQQILNTISIGTDMKASDTLPSVVMEAKSALIQTAGHD
jgi:hypothetical protein